MADEIRKIANLRTEASAPDLPGRVQNEEFVFDEMIGAELAQEVCRHKDIRSVLLSPGGRNRIQRYFFRNRTAS